MSGRLGCDTRAEKSGGVTYFAVRPDSLRRARQQLQDCCALVGVVIFFRNIINVQML